MNDTPARPYSPMSWIQRHAADFRLSFKTTVAGLATYAVVEFLHLHQGAWAVLSAVLIMQASVGASLRAARDRLISTLGGAGYSAAVVALLPHDDPVRLSVALGVALAPVAFLTSIYSSFKTALITTVIILLSGTGQSGGLVGSAMDRVVEIALGSVIGLGTALFLLPTRAHGLIALTSSRILDLLARLLTESLADRSVTADSKAIQSLHDALRSTFVRVETITDEATRERQAYLSTKPSPDALLRTLRRLRYDMVIIGRVTAAPFPSGDNTRIRERLAVIAQSAAAFLHGTSQALIRQARPPGIEAVEAAVASFQDELAALHAKSDAASIGGAPLGMLITLGFALEHLSLNFKDLHSRVDELAEHP